MISKSHIEYIDPVPVDMDGAIFTGSTKGGLHIAFKKSDGDSIEVLEVASHPGVLRHKLKKMGVHLLAKSDNGESVADISNVIDLPEGVKVYWIHKDGNSLLHVDTPSNSYDLPVGQLQKSELPEPLQSLYEFVEIYHKHYI